MLFVSLITFIGFTGLTGNNKTQEPFYVGVTYGGNNVQDAETLIDKVANYTNLFVLQSGDLKNNASAVNEVGDYAVSKGLHFAAYFDVVGDAQNAEWIGTAKQRWGDMFGGVYLGDEPGGKTIDNQVTYTFTYADKTPGNVSGNSTSSGEVQEVTVTKTSDRVISSYDDKWIDFFPDGKIVMHRNNSTFSSKLDPNNSSVTISCTILWENQTAYEPNGSVTVRETITNTTNAVYTGSPDEGPWGRYFVSNSRQILMDNLYTIENGSSRIAQEETLQQVQSRNPIPDYDTAEKLFISRTSGPIDNMRTQWNITKSDFPIFTSDYGLYWWDYKSGYDLVLAQLGWNNSAAQEIALVRGAANMQGKTWGTILTWKYTQAPYLASGDEVFNQMKTSYENGAQYVILFNYAKDMSGPYGTLQEEHFQALERFWNEVVHNSTIIRGGVKTQAALILPENYGWGMRNPDDSIWGIWKPNSAANQTWSQVQSKFEQYGTKIDIVYADPAYPIAGIYANIFSLNKTE
jgi:hypothetical protein